MKPLGIVRRIDELGRVVIPAELRESLDLGKHAPLEMFATTSGIFMRPYDPGQAAPADAQIDPVEM